MLLWDQKKEGSKQEFEERSVAATLLFGNGYFFELWIRSSISQGIPTVLAFTGPKDAAQQRQDLPQLELLE